MIDDDNVAEGAGEDEGEFNDEPETTGPTEAGHYVYRGDELLGGPYLTAEDAQSHIDGHLDGDGEVRFVEANPSVND